MTRLGYMGGAFGAAIRGYGDDGPPPPSIDDSSGAPPPPPVNPGLPVSAPPLVQADPTPAQPAAGSTTSAAPLVQAQVGGPSALELAVGAFVVWKLFL